MWTAGSAKSTSAETISSCAEPVSLAELLQAVPDFVGDSGERVLIQHSRNPFGVSQTEQQSRPRQIGIASGAVEDLEQQRHFLGWYPPRQLSEFWPTDREFRVNPTDPGFRCRRRFTGCRFQLHRRPTRKCVQRSPASLRAGEPRTNR